MLFGSAPVVLLSLPAGLAVDWGDIGWAIWAGTFYSVLISAFLGWLVWGWINAVRGVARTAPLMYLMPPVAGLVAWALTGERYTAVKVARRGADARRRRAGAVRLGRRATRCGNRRRRSTEPCHGRRSHAERLGR